ncbi:thermostable hemolysin [Lysobacter sp. S4-A87]|uniref:thermostable hemolysin n=1 Tax=Lysobacter sp. S4-A87 TaxID=2925843 RepID=UPI0031F31E67
MLTRKLRHSDPGLQVEHVDAGHRSRSEVEAFIAHVYRRRYDADLRSFLPHLLAFRDGGGDLYAAVGVRYGVEGDLFVEQYLDEPAQTAISARLCIPVERSDLVEVGNFASLAPGDARTIITRLTQVLHGEGARWVLFAATRQLRNAFNRLHLRTQILAPARPDRLGVDCQDWGRYYEAQPQVVWGDIAAGHAHLHGWPSPADMTEVVELHACGGCA